MKKNDLSQSDTLRWAPLNIAKNENCNNTICAKTEYMESVCNGDSGGPLVREKDQRTLVGLTSFSNNDGCHFGIPQSFSRITLYVGWITNTKNN